MSRIVYDPYENVDWGTVERHKSEFHNHAGNFDGHEVIDMYTANGPDANGNTLPDDEKYTILALGDVFAARWPWTDLSSEEEGWENRDPEQLGVVAFPSTEVKDIEHINTPFSTVDINVVRDKRSNATYKNVIREGLTNDEAHGYPEGLVVLAHPDRYLEDPERDWKRYLNFYRNWSREDGLIGQEALTKNTRNLEDVDTWDRALSALAPDRMLWGFGVDDSRPQVIGDEVDCQYNKLLLGSNEFDVSDQVGTRANAVEAYKEGRFIAYMMETWDEDTEDRPEVPIIESVEVDHDAQTIQIDATGYDTIRWVSRNGIVGEDTETFDVTEDVQGFLRVGLDRLDSEGSYATLQPWGIEAPNSVQTEYGG